MNKQERIKMDKISIKTFLLKYNVVIPEFQRKYVWNNEKKFDLIESLQKGFPIGAITLFEEYNQYLLVDGLQRVNTIFNYLRNPSSIISFKIYIDSIKADLGKFVKDYNEKNCENIKVANVEKSIEKWYSQLNTKTYEQSLNYSYEDFDLLKNSLEESKIPFIANFNIFQNFRNLLLKPIDINDQEVVIIIYQGDSDNLPTIFSKINKKNVNLTGYEILHSQWHKYIIKSSNSLKYRDAFFSIKGDGFIANKIDDSIPFNMYMNIAGLTNIILSENKSVFKKIFHDRTYRTIEKGELFFDVYSTILIGKSNKVNAVVKAIFDNDFITNRDEFILDLNDAIYQCTSILNNMLESMDILNISSRYIYLYMFYYVFYKNYLLDTENYVIKRRESIVNYDHFPNYKIMMEEKWFVDHNRQLSFFENKIKDIQKNIKLSNENDIKIDEVSDNVFVINNNSFEFLSKGKKEVIDIIDSIGKIEFELNDIKFFENHLRELHPSTNDPISTVRRILQELRDIGLIKFYGNGRYKKLWVNNNI